MAKGSGATKSGSSSNPKGLGNNGRIITKEGLLGKYKVLVGFDMDIASNAKNVLDNYIYNGQKITNGSSSEGVNFYTSVADSTIKAYANDYKKVDKIYKDMSNELGANSSNRSSIESKYEKILLDYINKRKKQLNS